MAITQIIAPLPAVLNDSETFYEDIAIRNNSLVTVSFPSINTWSTQANALAVEVNDKAAQVAAQAVDGGYSQTYINTNFVGVNNAQTIAGIKTFSSSPIVPTPTTGTQAVNKDYVDSVATLNINALPNKTTPVDTDNLALQETEGLLKKLSWANLKEMIFTDSTLTGTPTAPTANAGTNTTQLATTEFVKANSVQLTEFTQSLATNGYTKLPNGLIIQWGTTSGTSSTNIPITFPITFPSNCINMGFDFATAPIYQANFSGIYLISKTTSSANLGTSGSYNNGNIFWYAIGY